MAESRKPIGTARALRQRLVPAEGVLWKALRNRALGGFKFRRQHPVGPYVVDFACVECRVAVELDGVSHLTRADADGRRTAFLAAEGWHVLRFWNTEVYDELDAVKQAIYRECVRLSQACPPPHPYPSPPAVTVRNTLRRSWAGGEGIARVRR